MCVNCTEANERIYPTNKTQVFNEISIMEIWLIIHVINSRTLLVILVVYLLFTILKIPPV